MRNTMLGHMSLNTITPFGSSYNPMQMDFVKHSVDIYKNFIRDFLPSAKIYHHTPDTKENINNGYSCLEISAENKEKGAAARKHCKAACIGCMKCVKACEHDAVKVENFLASVDPEKCIGCGKCHEVCPVGCIDLITPKG